MPHHITGPFWGNVAIMGIGGAITLACFAAMFWFLLRPGERDRGHPKHQILNDDR